MPSSWYAGVTDHFCTFLCIFVIATNFSFYLFLTFLLTEKWLRLKAWFLHCSMLFHSEMCLFANQSSYATMYASWCCLCLFLPHSFYVFLHYHTKVKICCSNSSWLHGRLINCSCSRSVSQAISLKHPVKC